MNVLLGLPPGIPALVAVLYELLQRMRLLGAGIPASTPTRQSRPEVRVTVDIDRHYGAQSFNWVRVSGAINLYMRLCAKNTPQIQSRCFYRRTVPNSGEPATWVQLFTS